MTEKEYTLYIDSFLSIIMPVVLEKGVPGYYAEASESEPLLSEGQVNAVLTYSVYYCTLNYLASAGYDYQEIINTLENTIKEIEKLF